VARSQVVNGAVNGDVAKANNNHATVLRVMSAAAAVAALSKASTRERDRGALGRSWVFQEKSIGAACEVLTTRFVIDICVD